MHRDGIGSHSVIPEFPTVLQTSTHGLEAGVALRSGVLPARFGFRDTSKRQNEVHSAQLAQTLPIATRPLELGRCVPRFEPGCFPEDWPRAIWSCRAQVQTALRRGGGM